MKSTITNISFPGLGINDLQIDRVAFTLKLGDNSFEIYWYSIFILIGIVGACIYAAWRAKTVEKISTDELIFDVGIVAIVCAMIGARAYYVITSLDSYPDPSKDLMGFITAAVNIRNGGLAIYGGIIGGFIGAFVVCWIKKLNFMRVLDAATPGIILAQACGRWGNFFNAEAHGGIVSEGSPLYFLRMVMIDNEGIFGAWHPTFLYESVWNLLGFVLLTVTYKGKKFNGQIAFSYLAWYGIGRFFVEGMRTDSLYFLKSVLGETIRISQAVGIICFVVFTALIVWFLIKAKKFSQDPMAENIGAFEKIFNVNYFFPSNAELKKAAENAKTAEGTTIKVISKNEISENAEDAPTEETPIENTADTESDETTQEMPEEAHDSEEKNNDKDN